MNIADFLPILEAVDFVQAFERAHDEDAVFPQQPFENGIPSELTDTSPSISSASTLGGSGSYSAQSFMD
jgi:hypothetical protein